MRTPRSAGNRNEVKPNNFSAGNVPTPKKSKKANSFQRINLTQRGGTTRRHPAENPNETIVRIEYPAGNIVSAFNTLSSGLSLVGVVVIMFLQRKELKLQQQNLQLIRNQLNNIFKTEVFEQP